MRKLPRLLLGLASLLCAGGGGLLQLLSLGGVVSARLDLLSHFTPLWTALALLGALGGLASSGWFRQVAIAAGLAGVLVGALVMTPEFVAAAGQRLSAPKPGPADLRIVQSNLWADNIDPPLSAAVILAAHPDVVVLEETTERGAEVVDLLRPHFAYGAASSLATILSRRPGVGDVQKNEGIPVTRFRTTDASGRPVTILGLHYSWPEPMYDQARQRRALENIVRSNASGTLIVAGDFNLTPWSHRLRAQDRRLGLQRRTRAVFSWPSPARAGPPRLPFPILPLDQVYAGSGWKTVEVRRLPRTGSDHYPLLVVLAPKG